MILAQLPDQADEIESSARTAARSIGASTWRAQPPLTSRMSGDRKTTSKENESNG
jgi:hypothetical protein